MDNNRYAKSLIQILYFNVGFNIKAIEIRTCETFPDVSRVFSSDLPLLEKAAEERISVGEIQTNM